VVDLSAVFDYERLILGMYESNPSAQRTGCLRSSGKDPVREVSPVNLNQLWIFYHVAKHRSFSLAAEALFLTQPSVSTQVKLLENTYKIRLFERFGKKIELTDHGQILYGYAEKIFNLVSEADGVINDMIGMERGTIRISAGLTIGTYYLPPLLERFKRKFPNIDIQMKVVNSQEVIENTLSFKSDLGFIGSTTHYDERLVVSPFMEEEFVLIVSPRHEFGRLKTIPFSRLNGQPFLLREQGSSSRQLIEDELKRVKVSVKVTMELGSNEAIKRCVEADLGISMISRNVIGQELKAGRLNMVALSNRKVTRKSFIIFHKDKYLSSVLRSFLKVTSEFSEKFVL
jgi:DNA-binding transcriptional LysR family regulator